MYKNKNWTILNIQFSPNSSIINNRNKGRVQQNNITWSLMEFLRQFCWTHMITNHDEKILASWSVKKERQISIRINIIIIKNHEVS